MVHTVTLSARRGPIDASPTQGDKDHHVEVQDRFCCHHYDASASDAKFTTPYDWQHCKGVEV